MLPTKKILFKCVRTISYTTDKYACPTSKIYETNFSEETGIADICKKTFKYNNNYISYNNNTSFTDSVLKTVRSESFVIEFIFLRLVP